MILNSTCLKIGQKRELNLEENENITCLKIPGNVIKNNCIIR